jgi:putative phage-type endonuclease
MNLPLIQNLTQGTPEWFAARCGKLTASRVADAIARTKTGWGASRANYMAELLAERLTGHVAESYVSSAMQWGKDCEDEARRAYAFRLDRNVEEVGFVPHPNIAMSGASPDGLIGEDGLIEIKAPNTATHIEVLLSGTLPARHVTQILWQMACTSRAWCDFVSYDPRLPESMRFLVIRVPRDEAAIQDLEQEVCAFLAELEARIQTIHSRIRQPVPIRTQPISEVRPG